jgi:hypothetical protein
MRVLSSRSFVHSYSSLNKLLNHLTFNPKGLAQVVKVLDFGGITIRSKIQIPLGANNFFFFLISQNLYQKAQI